MTRLMNNPACGFQGVGHKKLTFVALLLALVVQFAASEAVARSDSLDSWMQFRNHIVASSAGAYGVVVNQREGGVEFIYFARGAELGPIEASPPKLQTH